MSTAASLKFSNFRRDTRLSFWYQKLAPNKAVFYSVQVPVTKKSWTRKHETCWKNLCKFLVLERVSPVLVGSNCVYLREILHKNLMPHTQIWCQMWLRTKFTMASSATLEFTVAIAHIRIRFDTDTKTDALEKDLPSYLTSDKIRSVAIFTTQNDPLFTYH